MLGIQEFFQTRREGFYLALAAAVLSVVEAIVYLVGYIGSPYMSLWAAILPFVAAALFAVLCMFKVTERWAPLAMTVVDFIAFLLYINAVYLYLSEVFFAGVTAEAFKRINPLFVAATILYLVTVILGNIAVYLRQSDTSALRADAGMYPVVGQ